VLVTILTQHVSFAPVRSRTERRTPVLRKIAFALVAVAALVFAGAAFAKTLGVVVDYRSVPRHDIPGRVRVPCDGRLDNHAAFRRTVTFDVSTQAGNPFVNLKCYGNGVGYDSWAAFWPTAGTFILSSPA
jgi:hypothetical protein